MNKEVESVTIEGLSVYSRSPVEEAAPPSFWGDDKETGRRFSVFVETAVVLWAQATRPVVSCCAR